jgi:asparagine synthase (glutamine-hydrolysing)
MVSDVPIGAFLSGGVDSSLIVAKMGQAKTFSIGFEDSTYDELPFANRVARHLKADHRTELANPNVVSHFDRLMEFMDDPIGDFSIFPTFLVSKLAREDVKVVLSGDGGDELFGGYDTFVAQRWAKVYGLMPPVLRQRVFEPLAKALPPSPAKKGMRNKVKRFIDGAAADPVLGHARWRLFSSAAMNSQLLAPGTTRGSPTRHVEKLFHQAAQRSGLESSLYVDVKSYLSDNILTKVDRMSMAVSLEARVPMLDLDLVSLAFSLPDRLKISRGTTKVALKQLAARYVPNDCVYRPKEGFSMPVKSWLAGQFRPLMDELLDSKRLDRAGVFRADTVERLKREHLSLRANHSHLLWSLMIFEAWRERWLESPLMSPSLAKEAGFAR